MTYDQQTRWTTPGPVAGWQWTIENLDYALAVVPKEKLSLGIPLYGYHWFTGAPNVDKVTGVESPNPSANYISAPDAQLLATTYKAPIQWDATTGPPGSSSIATRCANGFSLPTCAPFANAIN